MKKWKVIIEENNKRSEIKSSGESYSDIYIKILKQYPDCKIISISEIRPIDKKNKP